MNLKYKQISFIFYFIISFSIAQNENFRRVNFITNNKDSVFAIEGKFNVLENRNRPNGKKLTLYYIKFKSTSPNPSYPIIYLAGGPGGSGIKTAKGKRFSLFMKLREIADVIVFDQRGTGKSNQLPRCKSYVKFDQTKPIDKKEYLEKTSDNIKKCLQFYIRNGHDLSSYNTAENAKDIEELRKVLEVDKISLLGTSYGSHLAIEYIRNFEDRLDKVVLSALEGPDETIKLPFNTDAFVKEICKRARDNYGQQPKYPELEKKIVEVHNRFKQNNITVNSEGKKGGADSVGISEYELKGVVSNFYLKNPEYSKELPTFYNKLYHANYKDLAKQVKIMKQYAGAFRPMAFAMDMSSGISIKRNKKIAKQISKSIYETSLSFLYYDWMNTLDFKQLPSEFRILKENHVKSLLLSGDLDGRTYLNAAKKIAKKFKKGKHIVVENAGHDLLVVSPKVTSLISDFFMGKYPNIKTIRLKPTLFN